MAEQDPTQRAKENTKERIERYRAAAQGLVAIFTFSHDGEVQREITISDPNNPLEIEFALHERNYRGFDSEGNLIGLRLDDPMTPEQLTELADSLEAQITA